MPEPVNWQGSIALQRSAAFRAAILLVLVVVLVLEIPARSRRRTRTRTRTMDALLVLSRDKILG